MRKLVYCACDHAWRTRRGNEGRTRQQNRGVYRDHWRQNGYAAGPRLRPWPTSGDVRRRAIILPDPKQQMARAAMLPPSANSGSLFMALSVNCRDAAACLFPVEDRKSSVNVKNDVI